MTSSIFSLKISKVILLYKKVMNQIYQIIDQLHFYHQYQRFFNKNILTQLTLYLEDNKIIHPHQYGFCKRHKLIKSYLENRKPFVEFNKECSEMKNIENGVPPGSMLGPLVFLIYINDIPNASNIFSFLMYADDTTLYCCLEDINHVNKQAILNQELDHLGRERERAKIEHK